ncbi:hypothetical protein BC351_19660 [Paenibacillus ferrarius]|uniref:Uncharacterized protein n=1 Tax=Paenibacillus ferrarius TaxID=1469647 RepID=A0A1V4HPC6_9BACL|nr:hypothetical protein BC351_19660 [Paenibacillus ferrarius]
MPKEVSKEVPKEVPKEAPKEAPVEAAKEPRNTESNTKSNTKRSPPRDLALQPLTKTAKVQAFSTKSPKKRKNLRLCRLFNHFRPFNENESSKDALSQEFAEKVDLEGEKPAQLQVYHNYIRGSSVSSCKCPRVL